MLNMHGINLFLLQHYIIWTLFCYISFPAPSNIESKTKVAVIGNIAIQIEGIIPLNLCSLMVQCLQIILWSKNTLYSSMIACLFKWSVGGLGWMTFLLIPLVRMRPFGWRAFEDDEVFELVKALSSDQALGLDNFSVAFFQACWDVPKEDIMNVFHDLSRQRNVWVVWGGLWKISGTGGRSLVILDLRWVMAPWLNFGMMCGAGTSPLR